MKLLNLKLLLFLYMVGSINLNAQSIDFEKMIGDTLVVQNGEAELYEWKRKDLKSGQRLKPGDIVMIKEADEEWLKLEFLQQGYKKWLHKDALSNGEVTFKKAEVDVNFRFKLMQGRIKQLEEKLSSMQTLIEEKLSSMQTVIHSFEKKFQNWQAKIEKIERMQAEGLTRRLPIKKPSEEDIIKAVMESLQKRFPAMWAGSMMGARNVEIDYVEVVQIGIYNERKGYWPARVRVVGRVEANYLTRTEWKELDRIGNFRVYKGDYGEWKAEILVL